MPDCFLTVAERSDARPSTRNLGRFDPSLVKDFALGSVHKRYNKCENPCHVIVTVKTTKRFSIKH
jgi:hypothetical protein